MTLPSRTIIYNPSCLGSTLEGLIALVKRPWRIIQTLLRPPHGEFELHPLKSDMFQYFISKFHIICEQFVELIFVDLKQDGRLFGDQ
jgi:hypothetical protein